jgi:hypothetical protein
MVIILWSQIEGQLSGQRPEMATSPLDLHLEITWKLDYPLPAIYSRLSRLLSLDRR